MFSLLDRGFKLQADSDSRGAGSSFLLFPLTQLVIVILRFDDLFKILVGCRLEVSVGRGHLNLVIVVREDSLRVARHGVPCDALLCLLEVRFGRD